jgi:hypothetical protein
MYNESAVLTGFLEGSDPDTGTGDQDHTIVIIVLHAETFKTNPLHVQFKLQELKFSLKNCVFLEMYPNLMLNFRIPRPLPDEKNERTG